MHSISVFSIADINLRGIRFKLTMKLGGSQSEQCLPPCSLHMAPLFTQNYLQNMY